VVNLASMSALRSVPRPGYVRRRPGHLRNQELAVKWRQGNPGECGGPV